MAFEIKNLAHVSASGVNAGENVINVFTYFSETDTTANMVADGYFSKASKIFSKNDIIDICGIDSQVTVGQSDAKRLLVRKVVSSQNLVEVSSARLMGDDVFGAQQNESIATFVLTYPLLYGGGTPSNIVADINMSVMDCWLYSQGSGGSGGQVQVKKNNLAVIADFLTTPTTAQTRQDADKILGTMILKGDSIDVTYPVANDMAAGRLFLVGYKERVGPD